MYISIPRERRDSEYRVGLTPAGVQLLTQAGHTCYVEHDAGIGSGFHDYDYQQAGARIVYQGDEAYGRADLVLKVARPTVQEFEWMRPGQTIMGFLHMAAASPNKVRTLLEKNITAIGYEIIQDDDGHLPVLQSIGYVAGAMVPQVAASLAQNNHGGKGILLGGAPGVAPAEVVIIGAGTVGTAAARTFLGMGASVYVLDKDLRRLQALYRQCSGRCITMLAHESNIAKVARFADIIVGAVLVPGARAPIVITREMVKSMRKRSILMDISIDQGGCAETSRPTTHTTPTFVEEGVIHYCVPNITGVLGRTATHAINNAAWPFIKRIANVGLAQTVEENPTLARGLYTHQGEIVHPMLRKAFESRRETR
ncbi:MAG: alanine dehydrogenase [Anaerolineae bacterium]|nr:MAG: alanine dehydrogenase [Anaerolineae bacterium]